MNSYLSLKDFVKKQISGDWGKAEFDNKNNTEVYCIRGADINSVNEGNYGNLPIRYIENKNISKFLSEGNIIIEISGGSPTQSTGRVSYVRGLYTNIICSNFCRAFEIKEDFSSKYFFYLIKNIYNSNVFFNFESKTTGIKNLLLDLAFENIKVPKIDLQTQQKIAAVLSALDNKIELNNKINAELEQMAKTLYDYWFVQFDFPNEDSKPYKSSGGKMVYNKTLKREIPEGWEVKRLGKVLNTYLGGTPSTKKEAFWNGDIPWMNSGEVSNFPLITTQQKITEEAIKNSSTRYLKKGSVLLSITRHLRVNILAIDACINQSIAGIEENESFKNSYIYFSVLNDIDRLMKLRTGAQQPHINKEIVDNSPFLIPSQIVLEGFYKKVDSIIENIILKAQQNQELAKLRDWLLPMLMNGQVKVAEAVEDTEKQLGMVAESSVDYKIKDHIKEDRFALWLSNQKLAARGDIDEVVLREIFDAIDDEDQ